MLHWLAARQQGPVPVLGGDLLGRDVHDHERPPGTDPGADPGSPLAREVAQALAGVHVGDHQRDLSRHLPHDVAAPRARLPHRAHPLEPSNHGVLLGRPPAHAPGQPQVAWLDTGQAFVTALRGQVLLAAGRTRSPASR